MIKIVGVKKTVGAMWEIGKAYVLHLKCKMNYQ